jgi:transposase InsO family protein
LMGLPRSTFYDVPTAPVGDVELVAKIVVICDEFETYGYRRVRAELRHQGFVVNGKKIRRLMRENGLQPKRRRRYVITTNSDHESPIFPDLARDQKIDGPNQLWVADITYIAIETGFVYLAVILDAWSRRVVGYAISRAFAQHLALPAIRLLARLPVLDPRGGRGLRPMLAETSGTVTCSWGMHECCATVRREDETHPRKRVRKLASEAVEPEGKARE